MDLVSLTLAESKGSWELEGCREVVKSAVRGSSDSNWCFGMGEGIVRAGDVACDCRLMSLSPVRD